MRAHEKGIAEVHIHFCHEQGGQEFGKFARHLLKLYHHHVANPKGHVVLMENVFGRLWIAHNDACDGRVGLFGNAESDDMGVARREEFHDLEHRTDLVGQKY
jgi:hypothetical protein